MIGSTAEIGVQMSDSTLECPRMMTDERTVTSACNTYAFTPINAEPDNAFD